MTDIIYAESWKPLIDYQLEENPVRMNSLEKADEECCSCHELEEKQECNKLSNSKVTSEFHLHARKRPWVSYLTGSIKISKHWPVLFIKTFSPHLWGLCSSCFSCWGALPSEHRSGWSQGWFSVPLHSFCILKPPGSHLA